MLAITAKKQTYKKLVKPNNKSSLILGLVNNIDIFF